MEQDRITSQGQQTPLENLGDNVIMDQIEPTSPEKIEPGSSDDEKSLKQLWSTDSQVKPLITNINELSLKRTIEDETAPEGKQVYRLQIRNNT